MIYRHLHAKSKPPGDNSHTRSIMPGEKDYLLSRHLQNAFDAADCILDSTVERQFEIMGLPYDAMDCFRSTVKLAAICHDLGKAAELFQQAVRASGYVEQILRHEWLTVYILCEMKDWLSPVFAGVDREMMWWALLRSIYNHHCKSVEKKGLPEFDDDIEIHTDHEDFKNILEMIKEQFELDDPPHLYLSRNVDEILGCINRCQREWERFKRERRRKRDDISFRFIAAVTATLMGADASSSALPEKYQDHSDRMAWIKRALNERRPAKREFDYLIEKRLGRHGNVELKEFQREMQFVANDETVLIMAGCAGGKTTAALVWGASRGRHSRPFVFCDATTTNATEHYRGYFFDEQYKQSLCSSELEHSRKKVDKEKIIGAPTIEDDELERIESLSVWPAKFVVCTVDTLLGLLSFNKRPLYRWPKFVESVFVFDEIHSYDNLLFGLLLEFLEQFPGVPVLLMTASLQDNRRKTLDRVARKRSGKPLRVVAGDKEMEELPRYNIEFRNYDARSFLMNTEVKDAYNRGLKILFVVNTVNRCMEAAEMAKEAGINATVFHSRYRYCDRRKIHKEVISAFNDIDGPALVICTQVAEMSLDISADMLVIDMAPIPSMIQRLGRLNRRAQIGSETCRCFVLRPQKEDKFWPFPYDNGFQYKAEDWLRGVSGDNISQGNLIEEWKAVGLDNDPVERKESVWVFGQFGVVPQSTRKASVGITVIRQKDLEKVKQKEADLQDMLLPMPDSGKPDNIMELPRYRCCPIIPDKDNDGKEIINYDNKQGASWS